MKRLLLLLLASPLSAQTDSIIKVPYDTTITLARDSIGPTTHDTTYVVTKDSVIQVCCRDSLVPITKPPVGGMPSGFSRLAYHSCSQKGEDGFGYQGGGFSIQPAEATRGMVCRATYNAGWTAGRAPVNLWRTMRGQSRAYLSFMVRFSPNYVNQTVGTKVFYFVIDGKGKIFLMTRGPNLSPQVWTQSLSQTPAGLTLGPNQGVAASIKRGQWHHWEVLVTANTNGLSNGTIQWWFDGQLIGSYSGIRVTASTRTWEAVKWVPVYGGTKGAVPATQWMEIDDVVIGGAP